MEEEIDLREYVEVLIRYWKWIVRAALAAAVVALVVSLLLPPTYEATALVAVTKPRYAMQFDPRFEILNDVQPNYEAYRNWLQAMSCFKSCWPRWTRRRRM